MSKFNLHHVVVLQMKLALKYQEHKTVTGRESADSVTGHHDSDEMEEERGMIHSQSWGFY